MFGKLYRGWVDRLYSKNKELAPDDYFFEPYIHKKRIEFDQLHKLGNDDVKQAIIAQRLAFHAYHRTNNEIEVLISQYVFKVASRYYNIPVTRSKDFVKQYMKFRLLFIEEWYDVVDSFVIRKVCPDISFTSLEPRTVAMNVFPQDQELYADELDDRLQKYIKWHKKASKEAIQEARKSNDPEYLRTIQNRWDAALLYAKSLHDGMMEMAVHMNDYDNDDDFIVDDDDIMEDDEEISMQNKFLDDAMASEDAAKHSRKYEDMQMYDDDITEEEIERYLKKQDKKQRKRERKIAKFLERAKEERD